MQFRRIESQTGQLCRKNSIYHMIYNRQLYINNKRSYSLLNNQNKFFNNQFTLSYKNNTNNFSKYFIYGTRNASNVPSSSNVSSSLSQSIDNTFHPKIQTLILGFIFGMIFTSLYNREIPGYYRRLYRKAKKGDSEAQVELGILLIEENKTRAKKRAFQWFSAAADQGNQRAHYYLAMLHKNNDLEASNAKAAFYHFNCAANGDNTGVNGNISKIENDIIRQDASYELGLCYLEGLGCNRNVDKGLNLLETIGQNGNSSAAAMLSKIYTNGKYGIPLNSIRGLSWLREAARLGDKEMQEEMTQMYITKGKDIIDEKIVPIETFNKE